MRLFFLKKRELFVRDCNFLRNLPEQLSDHRMHEMTFEKFDKTTEREGERKGKRKDVVISALSITRKE